MVRITGVLRIWILDGLTPFGANVLCVFSVEFRVSVRSGSFVLVSSVRPSCLPYGE